MKLSQLSVTSSGVLEWLSSLCLRSRAYWGYDPQFLEVCGAELTVKLDDLSDDIAIIQNAERSLAIVHVAFDGDQAELDKLFVDAQDIGKGLGK